MNSRKAHTATAAAATPATAGSIEQVLSSLDAKFATPDRIESVCDAVVIRPQASAGDLLALARVWCRRIGGTVQLASHSMHTTVTAAELADVIEPQLDQLDHLLAAINARMLADDREVRS